MSVGAWREESRRFDSPKRSRIGLSKVDLPLLAGGLYAMSLPLEGVVRVPGLGTGSYLAGVLFAAALGLQILARGRVARPGRVALLYCALTAWWCTSLLWSHDPALTLLRLRLPVMLALVALCLDQVAQRPRGSIALVRAYVVGAGFSASVVLYNAARGETYRDVPGFISRRGAVGLADRFTSGDIDPNSLGLALTIALFLGSNSRTEFSPPQRVVVSGLLLPAVVLTGSRGAMLALLVAAVVSGIGLLRGGGLSLGRRVRAVGLLAALGLVVGNYVLSTPRFSAALADPGAQAFSRTRIWAAAWRGFGDSPILGLGYFAVGTATAAAGLGYRAVHNAYLTLLFEGGVVAAALGLLLVGTVYQRCRALRSPGLTGAATAIAVGALSLELLERKYVVFVLVVLGAWEYSAGARYPIRAPRDSVRAGLIPPMNAGGIAE